MKDMHQGVPGLHSTGNGRSGDSDFCFRLSRAVWRPKPRGRLFLLALLLASASPAWADAIITNLTHSALAAALAQGGLVRFAADGSVAFTNTISIANQVTLDASGHAVTLDGGNRMGLFAVQANGNLALSGLRLSGGNSPIGGALYLNPGAAAAVSNCVFTANTATNGGAVYLSANSTAVFSNCVFSANSAIGETGADGSDGGATAGVGRSGQRGDKGQPGYGGALYNLGNLTIFLSQFVTNRAVGGSGGNGGNGGDGAFRGGNGGNGGKGESALGGAIYNAGQLWLQDSSLDGNSATGGAGGQGGATGSGPFGNSAGSGGTGGAGSGAGLYNVSKVSILNCTFSANVATGGDSAQAGTAPSGRGTKGPNGGDSFGGAVFSTGTAGITNCTLYGNEATGGAGGNGGDGGFIGGRGGNGGGGTGGGLYSSGNAYVVNCTVAQNAAAGGTNGAAGSGPFLGTDGNPGVSHGGGLARAKGTLLLANSIAATNLISFRNRLGAFLSSGGNGYGSIKDGGYNISSDASLRLGSSSRNNTNPRLGSLAANGGPTKTMSLATNSPAIRFVSVKATLLASDQRGVPRPVGAPTSSGAFEPVTVPYILAQPQSQTVTAGANAAFAISVVGDALGYRWRFEDADISTATNATYAIAAAAGTNIGNYAVVITNSYGAVTSAQAFLTVITPPFITTQPTNLTVSAGDTAPFTVVAGGDPPLNYQWRFGGTNISGATLTVLPIRNAQFTDAGPYSVVVTNLYGRATSATAFLIVNAPPLITLQPTNQVVAPGGIAVFSVLAIGTAPLNYQWRFYGTNIPAARGPGLNIWLVTDAQPSKAGPYSVVISNTLGSVTSDVATLSVVSSISGRVVVSGGGALANVTITVGTNTTSTTSDGGFVVSGLVPSLYTVVPSLGSYCFSPPSQTCTIGTTNVIFMASNAGRHAIGGHLTDGSAALIGVPVILTNQYSAQTNVTDGLGNYGFAGLCPDTYTIMPLPGCRVFLPAVTNVTLGPSDVTLANFIGIPNNLFTIQGRVTYGPSGLPNVTVLATNQNGNVTVTNSTTTDSAGYYGLSQLCPGVYGIVPVTNAYQFTPPVLTVALGPNSTNGVDFAATPVYALQAQITNADGSAVSGVNVLVSGANGNQTIQTDTSGFCIISVPSGNYTLTPSSHCYSFVPPSALVTVSNGPSTIASFTATRYAYQIAGRIAAGSIVLTNLVVTLSQNVTNILATNFTTVNGTYTFSNLCPGLYSVQPGILGCYQFYPTNAFVAVGPDNTNINFSAFGAFTAGGHISVSGTPLAGVTVAATNAHQQPLAATTDANGNYLLMGLCSASYLFIPSLAGYSFVPPFTNVFITSDTNGLDFVATPQPSNVRTFAAAPQLTLTLVPDAPRQLNAFANSKNSAVQLSFPAVPGLNYRLTVSTNLKDWETILTTNPTSPDAAQIRFLDWAATNSPARFYRLHAQ